MENIQTFNVGIARLSERRSPRRCERRKVAARPGAAARGLPRPRAPGLSPGPGGCSAAAPRPADPLPGLELFNRPSGLAAARLRAAGTGDLPAEGSRGARYAGARYAGARCPGARCPGARYRSRAGALPAAYRGGTGRRGWRGRAGARAAGRLGERSTRYSGKFCSGGAAAARSSPFRGAPAGSPRPGRRLVQPSAPPPAPGRRGPGRWAGGGW